MNIIAAGEVVDDDTSAVQDILHTVNSVPTLEQSLYHHHGSPSSSLPHITKLVESTSITSSGLPSELATTPAAQKSQLSFIETSVPGGGFAVSGAGGRQVV